MNTTMPLRTAAVVLALVELTSVPSLAKGRDFAVPYTGADKLKSLCSSKGDTFDSSQTGHTCIKKGGNSVTCNKSNKTCRANTVNVSNPKKRPRILQEGGGVSEPDQANPKVLGGGNPRATPDGDMPDIRGDGAIQ